MSFHRGSTELPLTEMEALACKEELMTGVGADRKKSLSSEGSRDCTL